MSLSGNVLDLASRVAREVNAVKSFSIQRSNHVGSQLASTISNLSSAIDERTTLFGRDLGAGGTLPLTNLRRGDVYNLNGALMQYDGAAWVSINPNVGGDARYIVAAGGTINIAAGGNGLRVPLTRSEYTSPDVTPNAALNLFTLNRAGLWRIVANARYAVPAAGVGICYLSDSVGASGVGNIFAAQTMSPAAAVAWDVNLSIEKRFAVGQEIALWAYASAATNIDTFSARNQRTSIALSWVRP